VSEDQDPSNSNVMFLNKVRLLSDVHSGSLVPYTITPSCVSIRILFMEMLLNSLET